jgi:phage shock protein A
MSGMSDRSAFESFERMAEKIEASERRALAAAELNEEVSGDRLVQQFEALEYKGSSDQQLLELKQRMGLLPAGGGGQTRQLGAGPAGGDVHEAELIEEGDEGTTR